MNPDPPKHLSYRRATFSTRLPLGHRYTLSHCWLALAETDLWRVGLTKFAVRMLGEMVDHEFDVKPNAEVAPGDILGWIEGFKAISDLFCVGQGQFVRGNPELNTHITLINRDPYAAGWIYEIRGSPEPTSLDVEAYRQHLDQTIDRILAQQKPEDHPPDRPGGESDPVG